MTKISAAIIAIVAIFMAMNWLTNFIFRDATPDKLAVDVPGFEGPLVNRAALQRSWPNALDNLGARAQLRAHMRDVENLEAPKPLAGLAPVAAAPEPDFATLLANADIAKGERRARICASCHTFNEGGRAGVGPNLWSVVGRDIAAAASFNYSSALADEPGNWTYEKINAYLLNPNTAIPGNKMAFQGIRQARTRAEIIAYLRMQGSAQVPLPEPAAQEGDDAAQPGAENL